MICSKLAASFVVAFALVVVPAAAGQDSGNLTGRWVLNSAQSQPSREVGFNPDWLMAGRSSQGGGAAGNGSSGPIRS